MDIEQLRARRDELRAIIKPYQDELYELHAQIKAIECESNPLLALLRGGGEIRREWIHDAGYSYEIGGEYIDEDSPLYEALKELEGCPQVDTEIVQSGGWSETVRFVLADEKRD